MSARKIINTVDLRQTRQTAPQGQLNVSTEKRYAEPAGVEERRGGEIWSQSAFEVITTSHSGWIR